MSLSDKGLIEESAIRKQMQPANVKIMYVAQSMWP